MKNVSRDQIERLLTPVPPLAEQGRIVAKVDQLMTICDQLDTAIQTRRTTTTRLLDALIAEALADSPTPATVEHQTQSILTP